MITPVADMAVNSMKVGNDPVSTMNSEMKAAHAGQAQRRKEANGHGRILGHNTASPPKARDLAVVGPVVDHAGDKEEHGRDDPVREHVEHRAEIPAGVMAAMPNRVKPMWLTDE